MVLLLILTSGCYEPVEGCLDVDAKNYNVTADNECPSCCELPEVKISITFRYLGESFNLGDTLPLGENEVIIEDFHIFLSDLELEDDMGNLIYLEDSLMINPSNQESFFIKDNFRYFDRARFSADLSGKRYVGKVGKLNLKLGIPESINKYDIDSIRINSDIGTIPNDAYSDEDGFIFLGMQLNFQALGIQNLSLIENYPLSSASVELINIESFRAKDLDISLIFDIGTALEGINPIESEDKNILVLLENIGNAFTQN
jgi:hypothetical protein